MKGLTNFLKSPVLVVSLNAARWSSIVVALSILTARPVAAQLTINGIQVNLNANFNVNTVASGAPADSTLNVTGNQYWLRWTLVGGPVTGFFTSYDYKLSGLLKGPISVGGVNGTADFWGWELHVSETSHPVSGYESVAFNGYIQHLIGPHGETAQGPQLNFNYTCDAQLASFVAGKGKIATAGDSDKQVHPGHTPDNHFDYMDTKCVATVDLGGTQITGYTDTMVAAHSPEGSSIAMILCGLAPPMFVLRRKHQMRSR